MNQDDLKQTIQNMDVFRNFTEREADCLINVCRHTSYEPGQRIYAFGESSEEMLILREGKLEVVSESGVKLGEILPGASTGEMGVFTGQPRSAHVIASDKSEGLVIQKSDLDTLMASDQDIGMKVLQNMVALLSVRLSDMNSQMETQAHIIQRMQEKMDALPGEGDVQEKISQEDVEEETEKEAAPDLSEPDERADRETRTVDDVTQEGGTIDFGEDNGEVSGNVYAGGVIRGQGNVLVRGVVSGTPRSLSVIEVEGDVTLERTVSYGKIQGRRITVQDAVAESSLTSDLGGSIGGDLSESQVNLGNRNREIRMLRQFRIDMQRLQQQIEQLETRYKSESRRFVRDYPNIELGVGNMLRPEGRELHIDLSSFYQALSKRSSAVVDQALEEFFLKVIASQLTRANKHYITRNPSRQKVFCRFIADLREHVLLDRQMGKLKERMAEIENRRSALIKKITQPPPCELVVGGEVKANVVIRLLWFSEFHQTPEGTTEMEKEWSEVKTVAAENGLTMVTTDFDGETHEVLIEAGALKQGVFKVVDDRIQWVRQ